MLAPTRPQPPLNIRAIALQTAILGIVLFCGAWMIENILSNLERLGMTAGFGFLERGVGWDIGFTIIPFSPSDPYWRIFMIGVINTLLVGLICIVLASLFGTFIGIASISTNPLLRLLARGYVDVFRNVPLVLNAIFWYSVLTHLPPPKQAISVLDSAILSNRGIFLPSLNLAPWAVITAALVCIGSLVASNILRNRVEGQARTMTTWLPLIIPVAAIMAVLLFARTAPELVSLPTLKGLRFVGGIAIPPEFAGLVIAITLFSSAYIAEIVRAGFLAVSRGTLEAARALGLRPMQVMRKVHIPLALRTALPSLGNQYVYTMKATSVGIAIGFTDLFMVSSTAINQSGQVIEIMLIMMCCYAFINYTLTRLVNLANDRLKLKGY
ncbi:ABC transporter permease subunit [Ruegeria pomeroyi]|nr:ABC transporter permease subunit [Ruegeria pomeroyi]